MYSFVIKAPVLCSQVCFLKFTTCKVRVLFVWQGGKVPGVLHFVLLGLWQVLLLMVHCEFSTTFCICL